MTTERASPFAELPDIGSLDDIKPREGKRPPADKDGIRELNEKMNFPSRSPQTRSATNSATTASAPPAPPVSPAPVSPATVMKKIGRRRTGRTYPFGTKVTPDCYNSWAELAELSGKSLGELLEMAAPLLKAELVGKKRL